MGSTYKSKRIIQPNQSVFLAVPSNEKIKSGFAYSLSMTVSELTRRGIPFQVAIMEDNCHVDDGRNALVRDFLNETQCTDLVFIDSDVNWEPEMFLRLLSHDTENIIAGAYPFKSFPIRFPVGKLLHNETIEETKAGLLSVSYAPTGFMRIPRAVFEKLKPLQTRRGSKNPTYRFFERRYTVETYDGGDVTFCRKWIAASGNVLVDSKLKLDHIGEWRWSGCFLDHLSKDENKKKHTENSKDPVPDYKPDTEPKGSVMDAVQALEDGQESIEDFKIIADKWGNKPWAATAEYGELAWKMATNLKPGAVILECGSGFTSIILAIAAKKKGLKHIILECNQVWVQRLNRWYEMLDLDTRVVHTVYDSVRKWYDYDPNCNIDLLVCDGPDRNMGAKRTYPIHQEWASGAGALFDDYVTMSPNTGEWVSVDLGGKKACVGRLKDTRKEVVSV